MRAPQLLLGSPGCAASPRCSMKPCQPRQSRAAPFSADRPHPPPALGTLLGKHTAGLLLCRSHLCLAASRKSKTKASCESQQFISPSPLTPSRIQTLRIPRCSAPSIPSISTVPTCFVLCGVGFGNQKPGKDVYLPFLPSSPLFTPTSALTQWHYQPSAVY